MQPSNLSHTTTYTGLCDLHTSPTSFRQLIQKLRLPLNLLAKVDASIVLVPYTSIHALELTRIIQDKLLRHHRAAHNIHEHLTAHRVSRVHLRYQKLECAK
jgi:hypothetical protein